MGVLSNLEPKKVFYYFEEITKIPHGSGNVEQISDFLVDFAKAHKLFYIQDSMKNVIMVKEATPGYENEPVVILQGHMDMVAVQTPDCTMDMKTEGLNRPVLCAISNTSGLAGIAHWLNTYYKLKGDKQVQKNSELVAEIKKWVDEEYAGGRVTDKNRKNAVLDA